MAGNNASFDAAAFRDAIHFAMNMGFPEDATKRIKFQWSTRRTYAASDADATGNPWDWTTAPQEEVVNPEVEVLCAVDFDKSISGRDGAPAGAFDPTRVTITMLDDEYPEIFDGDGKRADLVSLDGSVYEIEYEVPPLGLFDVTVHQFVARARDEF